MKYISVAFFFLTLAIGGCQSSKPDLAMEKQKLRETDSLFSVMCLEKGLKESFLFYADTNVVKPNEGKFPLFGKEALRKSYINFIDTTFKLTWKPVLVEMSESADLGYTFGNWTWVESDTTEYGNYITIWKKQKDGSWKFVFDNGNNTPKPPTN